MRTRRLPRLEEDLGGDAPLAVHGGVLVSAESDLDDTFSILTSSHRLRC